MASQFPSSLCQLSHKSCLLWYLGWAVPYCVQDETYLFKGFTFFFLLTKMVLHFLQWLGYGSVLALLMPGMVLVQQVFRHKACLITLEINQWSDYHHDHHPLPDVILSVLLVWLACVIFGQMFLAHWRCLTPTLSVGSRCGEWARWVRSREASWGSDVSFLSGWEKFCRWWMVSRQVFQNLICVASGTDPW